MHTKRGNYFLVSLFIITFDQLTKFLIRLQFRESESISIIGDFFRLTFVKNPGAAFSFSFESAILNQIFFLVLPSVVVIVLICVILKTKDNNKYYLLSYSLILGGAVGNLIDRIFMGEVTDFLDFDFPDFLIHRWPTFNIADSSIVIAITIIFFYDIVIKNLNKKKLENNIAED